MLVDGESEPDALAALLRERPAVEPLALAENRGFAGGANAGLERAFGDGAAHALLLNDDVLVEQGCVEALVAAAGAAGRPRPASTDRPAWRSRVASSSCAAASAGTSRAPATTSRAPVCVSPAAPGSPWGRSTSRSSSTTRTSTGACAPGRRRSAARSRSRRARCTRRRLERRRGRRDLGLLLDAQPPVADGAAAGPPAADARRCARGARPVRALRSSRRAVARAKLAGVRDWSEHRMGRGPAGMKVAFDVACLTQSRAGTARLARGLATRCARGPRSS